MSLAISVDRVALVLLADGWHGVREGSFDIDAYEFGREGAGPEDMIFRGGQSPLVPSTGAKWTEQDGTEVFCPITAVLGVSYAPTKAHIPPAHAARAR